MPDRIKTLLLKLAPLWIIWQVGTILYSYLVTYNTPDGDSWIAFMLGWLSLAYFFGAGALMILIIVGWWNGKD